MFAHIFMHYTKCLLKRWPNGLVITFHLNLTVTFMCTLQEADGLGKNSVDMGYQLQKIGNEWKEYSVLIEQYIREDEWLDFDSMKYCSLK